MACPCAVVVLLRVAAQAGTLWAAAVRQLRCNTTDIDGKNGVAAAMHACVAPPLATGWLLGHVAGLRLDDPDDDAEDAQCTAEDLDDEHLDEELRVLRVRQSAAAA